MAKQSAKSGCISGFSSHRDHTLCLAVCKVLAVSVIAPKTFQRTVGNRVEESGFWDEGLGFKV